MGRTATHWQRHLDIERGGLANPVIQRAQPAQVGRHGVGFQAGQGARQDADGCLGRRGGGMPRLAVDGELHRQVAFFAHPDQRNRAAHPGCQTGADPAAFIDNPGQVDAALFEQLPHDLAAIHAAGLFIMPQAKQDGALRAVALLSSFSAASMMPINWFLISSVPRPQMKPSTISFEGRVGPLGRVGRDHILVRHQHDRLQVGAASLPGIQQAVAIDHFAFQLLVHQRVGLLQHLMELLERLRVRSAFFIQWYRLAAHRCCQVLGNLLIVHRDAFDLLHRAMRPLENDRPHHDINSGEDQNCQDDVQNV